MVKMKVLPEPLVKMRVGTEIIDVSEEAYDKGYSKGYSNGYTEGEIKGKEQGYTEGKQAEHDAFWDAYQDYGNRRSYKNAFNNTYWTNETFKPKYDLNIRANSYNLFDGSRISGSLTEILNNLGIKMEFSYISYQAGGFADTQFTEIDFILKDCAPPLVSVFQSSKQLHTLKIGTVTRSMTFNNTFNDLPALENVTIEGEIGKDINFQWSPLSVESMKNIISCLVDYSGTSNEYVYKVTFTEECWAALEADSTAPDGNKWADYVFNLGWLT